MGAEFKTKGVHVALSPMMNMVSLIPLPSSTKRNNVIINNTFSSFNHLRNRGVWPQEAGIGKALELIRISLERLHINPS